jgi:hypothetical protein
MGGPRPVDRVESAVTASTDRTRLIKAETASDQEEMAQKTSNCDATWTEFLPTELWASPELPSAKFDKCAPELTALNLDVNPLKTEMISIKGHENHSVQNSHHSHDLTYQSFCKTHVSHGNVALSSIAETNSRGLDAFTFDSVGWSFQLDVLEA